MNLRSTAWNRFGSESHGSSGQGSFSGEAWLKEFAGEELQIKLNAREKTELAALSKDSNSEMFFAGLLHFARNLEEKNRHNLAGKIYLAMQASQEVGLGEAAKAKERLAVLSGTANFGVSAETLLRRLNDSATDYRTIVPMLGATMIGSVAKTVVSSRLLASSSSMVTRGLGVKVLGGVAGFACESLTFAGLGRALHDSPRSLSQDIAASTLTLGLLKGGGALASKIHPTSTLARFAGAYFGILGSNHFEAEFGLREKAHGSLAAFDALAALVSLEVGAGLGRRLMGPRWAAFQAELGVRTQLGIDQAGMQNPFSSWLKAWALHAPLPAPVGSRLAVSAAKNPFSLISKPLAMVHDGRGEGLPPGTSQASAGSPPHRHIISEEIMGVNLVTELVSSRPVHNMPALAQRLRQSLLDILFEGREGFLPIKGKIAQQIRESEQIRAQLLGHHSKTVFRLDVASGQILEVETYDGETLIRKWTEAPSAPSVPAPAQATIAPQVEVPSVSPPPVSVPAAADVPQTPTAQPAPSEPAESKAVPAVAVKADQARARKAAKPKIDKSNPNARIGVHGLTHLQDAVLSIAREFDAREFQAADLTPIMHERYDPEGISSNSVRGALDRLERKKLLTSRTTPSPTPGFPELRLFRNRDAEPPVEESSKVQDTPIEESQKPDVEAKSESIQALLTDVQMNVLQVVFTFKGREFQSGEVLAECQTRWGKDFISDRYLRTTLDILVEAGIIRSRQGEFLGGNRFRRYFELVGETEIVAPSSDDKPHETPELGVEVSGEITEPAVLEPPAASVVEVLPSSEVPHQEVASVPEADPVPAPITEGPIVLPSPELATKPLTPPATEAAHQSRLEFNERVERLLHEVTVRYGEHQLFSAKRNLGNLLQGHSDSQLDTMTKERLLKAYETAVESGDSRLFKQVREETLSLKPLETPGLEENSGFVFPEMKEEPAPLATSLPSGTKKGGSGEGGSQGGTPGSAPPVPATPSPSSPPNATKGESLGTHQNESQAPQEIVSLLMNANWAELQKAVQFISIPKGQEKGNRLYQIQVYFPNLSRLHFNVAVATDGEIFLSNHGYPHFFDRPSRKNHRIELSKVPGYRGRVAFSLGNGQPPITLDIGRIDSHYAGYRRLVLAANQSLDPAAWEPLFSPIPPPKQRVYHVHHEKFADTLKPNHDGDHHHKYRIYVNNGDWFEFEARVRHHGKGNLTMQYARLHRFGHGPEDARDIEFKTFRDGNKIRVDFRGEGYRLNFKINLPSQSQTDVTIENVNVMDAPLPVFVQPVAGPSKELANLPKSNEPEAPAQNPKQKIDHLTNQALDGDLAAISSLGELARKDGEALRALQALYELASGSEDADSSFGKIPSEEMLPEIAKAIGIAAQENSEASEYLDKMRTVPPPSPSVEPVIAPLPEPIQVTNSELLPEPVPNSRNVFKVRKVIHEATKANIRKLLRGDLEEALAKMASSLNKAEIRILIKESSAEFIKAAKNQDAKGKKLFAYFVALRTLYAHAYSSDQNAVDELKAGHQELWALLDEIRFAQGNLSNLGISNLPFETLIQAGISLTPPHKSSRNINSDSKPN